MHGIGRKISISVFSILLLAGTLFLDEKFVFSKDVSRNLDVVLISEGEGGKFVRDEKAYQVEAGRVGALSISLGDTSVLRFFPASTAKVTPEGSVTLQNGRLWIATLNSEKNVEIIAGEVKIKALPGVFDVSYDTQTLQVSARREGATLEFLGNILILPEGRQIRIEERKLRSDADTIAKLRYSKLSKEFPFTPISSPDSWVSENQKEDERFFEMYRSRLLEGIRASGATVSADPDSLLHKLSTGVHGLQVLLTFDPKKKSGRIARHAISYFDSGVHALTTGKADLGRQMFDMFSALALEVPQTQNWTSELKNRLNRFSFIRPDDSLFVIKKTLRGFTRMESAEILEDSFRDVLDRASLGSDLETRNRVRTLLRQFGQAVETHAKEAGNVFSLSVRYNDFLDRNKEFLREEFLSIAEKLERSHLSRLDDSLVAEDQRQFLISEKLRTIRVLADMLAKEDMAFQDGRRVILLLGRQIEALKPGFASDTAVALYFEGELKKLSPLIAFLRSQDAENLRGSFQENFQDFQSKSEEMKKVVELLSGASGGSQISPFRREELAGIVSKDLFGIGIKNIKIVLPEGEDNPRVRIMSAQFQDKVFSGIYDTSNKVLSDLTFDGDSIPNAVRLENVEKFFLAKLGRLKLPTGVSVESFTEQPSQASVLEKVAKETIQAELKKLNIAVEDKYLGFENLNDGVIHVRLATIEEGADAKVFSFDVSQKVSVVSGLKVQTVLGEIPVNDTFALRELPLKVEAVYQRAVFEKNKEEELKKLLNSSTSTGTSINQ